MEDGKVIQSGSYENLLQAGTAFELLVSAHQDTINELNQDSENNGGSENEVFSNPQEEEKVIGNVGRKPLWDYINYSEGTFMLCLVILSQCCFLALQTSSNFWLAIAIETPKVTDATLIGVYALISFSSTSFVYVRSYFAALLGLKASAAFFSSFTTYIFNATMFFFDSTPVGRILTRVRYFHFQ